VRRWRASAAAQVSRKSLERSQEPLSVMTRATVTPWRSNQPSARIRKAVALSFLSLGNSSV
jgi:hypothetical protein